MTSKIMSNLKYSKEHEWVKITDHVATIGITDFAQESLGEIVFLELPEVGTEYQKDSTFGVVESIKSVSDLYVPLSGKVVAVNSELIENSELINSAPFDSWLIKIDNTNLDELKNLMDDKQYKAHCENI